MRLFDRNRFKADLTKYEEAKKEFKKIIGKPSISIHIELPLEFLNLEEEFLDLNKDERFLRKMEATCLEYLLHKVPLSYSHGMIIST